MFVWSRVACRSFRLVGLSCGFLWSVVGTGHVLLRGLSVERGPCVNKAGGGFGFGGLGVVGAG